jgi:hypothetical protein
VQQRRRARGAIALPTTKRRIETEMQIELVKTKLTDPFLDAGRQLYLASGAHCHVKAQMDAFDQHPSMKADRTLPDTLLLSQQRIALP